ncbi:growth arrest-specific 2-related [Schistosoma mansoni]|uniref:growth arrest-specific 2-related n=1 Tax=Schistosoma mansoni TaxID=6183 RepID=UPI0001A63877|nr:growth arrest-specific 2-related [Schistosoma mansoni]|eukprot:XP_018654852.1 growth arrest-specific 2-related [Schistosoma mansoni]
MIKTAHSVSNLHSTLELSPCVIKRTQSSHFVQILDESMCVVREDLTEWLQHYLFSTANACPIEAHYLLCRLASGLWLSRLAYKLHYSILESGHQIAPKSKALSKSTHNSNNNNGRSYEFLRGAVSNRDLKNLTPISLPSFPSTLTDCAKLPLGPSDLCSFSPQPTSYKHNSNMSKCNIDFPKENISLKSRVADRWIARDNVSAFIKWCKDLGVPETILFETNGLMNKTEEKNVLLTLMEVARIASRYGLTDLPYLVRMEREIDELEAKHSQDQILIDSQSENQFMDNKNSDNSVQTSTDNRDISCDSSVSLLSNHCSQNDTPNTTTTTMYTNSHSTNTHDVYNKNQCDLCRNGSSQVDNPISNNQNSTCHHHAVFETNNPDNRNSAKRSRALNSSLISLEDNNNDPSKVVTDQFVQQQVIGKCSPYVTKRKRQQTLNNLDLRLPIIEVTPVKITKTVNILSSVINTNNWCNDHLSSIGIDSTDNCLSSLSSFDLVNSPVTNSLSILQVESPKLKSLKVMNERPDLKNLQNSINTKNNTPPKLSVPLMDCLIYNENYEDPISTDPSTISSDDCLIDSQVNKKLAQCTCCNKLHMQRLEEGRYRLGSRIYYLRRFRNHVMVRVGGGWLTLDEFLHRHDPCRRGIHSFDTEPAATSNDIPPIKSCFNVHKPIRRHSELESPPISQVNSMSNFNRQWSYGSNSSMESPRSDSSMIDTGIVSEVSGVGSISQASSSLNSIKQKQEKPKTTPRLTIPKAPNLRTASRSRDSSKKNPDSGKNISDVATAASYSRASSAKRTNVPVGNKRDFRTPSQPRNLSSKREDSVSRASNIRKVSDSRESSTKREESTLTNCRADSTTRRTLWRN